MDMYDGGTVDLPPRRADAKTNCIRPVNIMEAGTPARLISPDDGVSIAAPGQPFISINSSTEKVRPRAEQSKHPQRPGWMPQRIMGDALH
ncbi:hypothetical protein PMIN04_000313 [Paraphaeosphaeria minitans]